MQYWSFLELIWKSHAEILSCWSLLLCLYCSELEHDLHKRIRLKERYQGDTSGWWRGAKGVEKADWWSNFCTLLCLKSVMSPWPALGRDVLPIPLSCFFQPVPLNHDQLLLPCPMVSAPSRLSSDLCPVWCPGSLGVPWAAEGSPTPAYGSSRGSASISLGQVLMKGTILLSPTSSLVPPDREILQGLSSFVVLLPDPYKHTKLPADFMGPYSICCFRHGVFLPGSFITPFLCTQ